MRPDFVGLGGFDSHALPPRARRVRGATFAKLATLATLATLALCALTALLAPATIRAQQPARAGVAPVRDTAVAPPIGPTRAFLYSLAVPGLGQAKLDRPIVGAGFFLMEAFAIALVHRTADDLRLARSFSRDSIPLRYAVDTTTGVVSLDARGNPVVAAWSKPYYDSSLVRSRRLQLEDWTAVLLFNHLIAGAEAFVAAELWDLPQHVKLRASPIRRGFAITATIGGGATPRR